MISGCFERGSEDGRWKWRWKMEDGRWRWKLWKHNQVSVKTFPYRRRQQCTHPCLEKRQNLFGKLINDINIGLAWVKDLKWSFNSPIEVKVGSMFKSQLRWNIFFCAWNGEFHVKCIKSFHYIWMLQIPIGMDMFQFVFEDFSLTFEKCSYYLVCIKYSGEQKNCDIKFLRESWPRFF